MVIFVQKFWFDDDFSSGSKAWSKLVENFQIWFLEKPFLTECWVRVCVWVWVKKHSSDLFISELEMSKIHTSKVNHCP